METLNIKILEPKAGRLLDDLESLKLIEIQKQETASKPNAASEAEGFGD